MKPRDRQMLSLPEHLSKVFTCERDREALALQDVRSSYGELLDGVLRTVEWYRRQGLQPGDRIAIHMVPCLGSVLCFLASLFYGTILVPLNPRYTKDETSYFLQDAEARLFLCRTAGWRRNKALTILPCSATRPALRGSRRER